MKDSVVEETRKLREELFAEFDYDLHKISQHFLEIQSRGEKTYVTREMLEDHLKAEKEKNC